MTTPHVCPWWVGYFLANPLRKIIQDPDKVLAPYLTPGVTALDIGPGMGFFTIPMARLIGESGRVIAVDLQERMIRSLKRRAARAGLADRIEARVCNVDSLGIDDLAGRVDFALAFAVLHETPDIRWVIREIHQTLKVSGLFLLAEPRGHVKESDFIETTRIAADCGFETIDTPQVRRSRTVLLRRQK